MNNIKTIFLKVLFEIINITRANIDIIEIFYHNHFDISHEYLSLFLFHSSLLLLFFIHLFLFPYFFLFFSIFLFFSLDFFYQISNLRMQLSEALLNMRVIDDMKTENKSDNKESNLEQVRNDLRSEQYFYHIEISYRFVLHKPLFLLFFYLKYSLIFCIFISISYRLVIRRIMKRKY